MLYLILMKDTFGLLYNSTLLKTTQPPIINLLLLCGFEVEGTLCNGSACEENR